MGKLPTRPCLAVTPEKLEEGTVNIIIRRGYSAYGGLKWKNKKQEREYLTRLCRSMIDHGAPAHHLEENLTRAASKLGVDLSVQMTAESILLSFADDLAPTLPLVSGDWESVHLAHLHDIYRVYDAVASYKMSVQEGIQILADISESNGQYSHAFLIFVYGIACTCVGPLMFNAGILDLPPIFLFGFCLGLLRRYVTPRSNHKDVVDMMIIVTTSCLARLLGSISKDQICFPALAQALMAVLLPGYTVVSGCLQLMWTNKSAGSSRIIYGIVQAVLLGFAVTVGTSIYGVSNENATSLEFCESTMPANFDFLFLPPLVVCIAILSQAKWQQIPAITIISSAGWLTSNILKHKVVTEIANLCGAFVLGVLVNLYSAVLGRSAAEFMLAGLFVQLPAGIAAHGSMVGGVSRADVIPQPTANNTAQANAAAMGIDSIIDLRVPWSVARVAIMLALGLRLSSCLACILKQRRLNC